MKKRILLASALSLFIHWLLFGLNWSFLKDRSVAIPKCRNVTITMSYKEPAPPAEQPQKAKKKIRIFKTEPRKEIKKKEIIKSAEAEKVAVEPVLPESEAEEAKNLKKEIPDETISEIESTAEDESAVAAIKEASPRYQKNPPPVYPRVARRRGHQGTVLLEVLVDRNGSVRDLRVLQTSGYSTLDNAALASVKGWIFDPGMKGSQPIEMWVRLPVRFQLK